jgi:hypothetical protein
MAGERRDRRLRRCGGRKPNGHGHADGSEKRMMHGSSGRLLFLSA